MRAMMIDHVVRTDLMLQAAALNIIYLSAGVAVFLRAFRIARKRGLLLHIGE